MGTEHFLKGLYSIWGDQSLTHAMGAGPLLRESQINSDTDI